MKKILLLALTLLLMFSFVGCAFHRAEISNDPEINQTFSDEFMKTFLDDYSVRDPNLYHYTAEEYGGHLKSSEVKRKFNIEQFDFDDLMIAKIDDVDMSQFMLGTRYRQESIFTFIGASEEAQHYVYSHKDAPDPIMDWTVKSIELYTVSERISFGVMPEDENHYRQSFGTYLKNTGKLLHSWENNEDNQAFISDVISAIKSESTDTFDNISGRGCISPTPEHSHTYVVINFNECNGIVWAAELTVGVNSFRISLFSNDNGYSLEREKGVRKSLSSDSNSQLDSIFNTLVTIEPNPITLPNYSDFEGIAENMTYEEVVSKVGFPHEYAGYLYGIEVRYNTVEGEIYQVYFDRYSDGKLIVAKTRSYVPESSTTNTTTK